MGPCQKGGRVLRVCVAGGAGYEGDKALGWLCPALKGELGSFVEGCRTPITVSRAYAYSLGTAASCAGHGGWNGGQGSRNGLVSKLEGWVAAPS